MSKSTARIPMAHLARRGLQHARPAEWALLGEARGEDRPVWGTKESGQRSALLRRAAAPQAAITATSQPASPLDHRVEAQPAQPLFGGGDAPSADGWARAVDAAPRLVAGDGMATPPPFMPSSGTSLRTSVASVAPPRGAKAIFVAAEGGAWTPPGGGPHTPRFGSLQAIG